MQKEYVGPDGRSVVKHRRPTIGTTLSSRGSGKRAAAAMSAA
jgi:hypothetical protein